MRIMIETMRCVRTAALIGAIGLATASCHDLTNQPLPAGTFDPTTVNNAAGARGMALAARTQFQFALANYISRSGLLTDELQANVRGTSLPNNAFPDLYVAVDARLMPQGVASSTGLATDMMYAMLQQLRALSNQAIGALAKYDADSSEHLRGELYAQEAYAEVWLADLFCSGVPLTTSDFQGDFTYKPSSTSEQVYTHAVVLFDTALTLAGDSTAIANLAKIGRARAHLALGQYTAAALDVDGIPVDYQYTQFIQTCRTVDRECGLGTVQAVVNLAPIGSMADREGGVGLPYRSSHDPRTAPLGIIGTVNNNDVWFPAKYTLGGFSAIVPASGIEAQLIAAEADLHEGGATWLTTLNALRTTGLYTGVDTLIEVVLPNPVDTAARDTTFRYDTAWVAGTGGVGHLGPLQDPGTPDGRIDLVFRERAFWLYLSGVRQGDLRRLVHTYRRSKNTLYPIGTYPGVGSYGDYIDAPIPTTGGYSETPNPYFRGCLSRD
jgi:hypothetical protein